jgi:hypothetical protein
MTNHPHRSDRHSDNPGRSPAPEAIKAAREAAGLDPRQAATLVHRAAHWWHALEKGERRMDEAVWDLFRLLAAPTQVEANALLDDLRRQQRALLSPKD